MKSESIARKGVPLNAKLCELRVEYINIDLPRPNPENPRVHSKKQLNQIAESMKVFGPIVPILVDSELQIIAGHGRIAAAKLIGIKRVPIIRIEHLTQSQQRAFMIADNRLTENSDWDAHLLGEQLQILSTADLEFDLEVTGFEASEVDFYIEGLGEKPQDNPADILPENSGPSVTRRGDLWLLDEHRVLCGNSLEEASYKLLMGDFKADLIFTDPPYNVRIHHNVSGNGATKHREFLMGSGEMLKDEFTEFLTDALTNSVAYCTDNLLVYVFMDWRHIASLIQVGEQIFDELKNLCVWAKDNAGMGSFYRSQHELIAVFKKGTGLHRNNVQLGKFGRNRTNIWTYPRPRAIGKHAEANLLRLHPTIKPTALIADAILDSTARNEIVLDPFLGSGSTLIAAEQTGRRCFGLELDPQYVDLTIRRWQIQTRRAAIHSSLGSNFDDLAEQVDR